MWNKVNLKKKDSNLPKVGERVIWVTNENSPSKNVFHQFYGSLTSDLKSIDYGYGRYKLTSNYWWQPKLENPKLE
jgi:hypothetical protein